MGTRCVATAPPESFTELQATYSDLLPVLGHGNANRELLGELKCFGLRLESTRMAMLDV